MSTSTRQQKLPANPNGSMWTSTPMKNSENNVGTDIFQQSASSAKREKLFMCQIFWQKLPKKFLFFYKKTVDKCPNGAYYNIIANIYVLYVMRILS
jgi:hypothetical protein